MPVGIALQFGVIALALAMGITALVSFLVRREPVLRSFGFAVDRWVPLEILVGLVLPFVAMTLVFLAEWGLRAVTVGPGTAGMGVLRGILNFAWGATWEELLFRVCLVTGLVVVLRRVPGHRWIVVLGTAAIFGAVHLGNSGATAIGAVGTGLGGIIYAVAYLTTRKIWLPLFLHFSWNLSEAGWGFPVSATTDWPGWVSSPSVGDTIWNGGGYGPETGLPGMLARVVIIVGVFVYVSRRWPGGNLAGLTYAPPPVARIRSTALATGARAAG